ncbi:MAG: insulinase family protein, partial [Lachnospiraceae bacterium]|nr:insulinase family protein [Candidatus Equihabitans merdae]
MNQKQREALLKLSAYELIKAEDLSDIRAEGFLFKHKKTGARVALIPCDDSNKVFNIGFRTPPEDSTGVAHIIEHTVLCGSDKYPLKDPFVELAKGSLNTFLNAMTYPDKTVYPVASTNLKDFKNLVDVYLDAVFHPNIYKEENIFKQEGWHYHLEKESDKLTYNGVVYNEMKGVFSSPEDVLDRVTMNALFPDTAYGVESGGDPKHIPDLTYEQFLDFHRRYYHPSNSYIYLYGDMDMAAMLNYMDKEYLSHYDYLAIDSELHLQEPFKALKKVEDHYPISDDSDSSEQQTYLSYAALVGDPFDNKRLLAIEAIDYALFSSPGAPVKEALIKSGLAKEVSGGFNDGILQPFYTITAKGADHAQADEFVKTIKKVLRAQVKKGIDKKALLAGINYQEFSYREGDYSVYPKGLIFGLNMFDTWLYDENMPFEALKNLDDYASLKEEISKTLEKGQ